MAQSDPQQQQQQIGPRMHEHEQSQQQQQQQQETEDRPQNDSRPSQRRLVLTFDAEDEARFLQGVLTLEGQNITRRRWDLQLRSSSHNQTTHNNSHGLNRSSHVQHKSQGLRTEERRPALGSNNNTNRYHSDHKSDLWNPHSWTHGNNWTTLIWHRSTGFVYQLWK